MIYFHKKLIIMTRAYRTHLGSQIFLNRETAGTGFSPVNYQNIPLSRKG